MRACSLFSRRWARRLLRNVQNGRPGAEFQAQRAYHYFQEGRLQSIEHPVGTRNWNGQRPRVDLRLFDGARVEVKSWTGFDYMSPQAQRGMVGRLGNQVQTYLGGRGR